jgi:hypothetical protein
MAIHQKFTGDPSQLIKAYGDLAAQNVRLEQQVAKLAQQMRLASNEAAKGQQATNAAIRQGVQEVTAYIQAWVGVGGAIAAAKMDFEQLNQQRERARQTNLDVGASQGDIVRNMAGKDPQEIQKYLRLAEEDFAKSKFPDLGQYNRAFSEGLSASSGNAEAARRATAAGAALVRDKPYDLPLIAGAALDLRKATGIEEAERNLSFMMQAGVEARITDTRQQALNMPPALIAGANTVKGDKTAGVVDAGAVIAAVGSQAADPRGDSTKTAVTKLFVEMRDAFEQGIETTVHGRKLHVRPKFDPGTIEGRITYLQEDERFREQFKKAVSFEQQYKVPMEQLLTKGSDTDKQFRASRQNLDFNRAEYDRTVANLEAASPQLGLSTIESARKGQLQLTEMRAEHEARVAQANAIRSEAIWQTTRYSPQMHFLKTVTDKGEDIYDFAKQQLDGTDPIEDALNRVERRRRDILQPRSLLGGRDNFAYARRPEDLNADEKRNLQFLDQQIALLKQLLEEDRASTKAMAEQNQLLRSIDTKLSPQPGSAGPSPAAARNERGVHREQ